MASSPEPIQPILGSLTKRARPFDILSTQDGDFFVFQDGFVSADEVCHIWTKDLPRVKVVLTKVEVLEFTALS